MDSRTQNIRNIQQFSANEILVFLLILVFTVVLRIPTLIEPWGGDQGAYGYIANGILNGKVPYRDMYTNTGYGLYFAYALFFKLFGNHMMAIHIGDLMASILTITLVYYLTKLLYGRECALLAAVIAALFGSGQGFSLLVDMKKAWGTYWQLAQRETFMAPLITASMLTCLVADRRQKWHLYFWVGLFIGLAIVFKVTAVVILGILVFYAIYTELLRPEGEGLKSCLFKITSLTIGAVLIQLPFLYYFWIHDSLYEMYKAVFVHTAVYAKLSRGLVIVNAFEGNTVILSENFVLWMFSLASIIYLMTYKRSRENYLVLAWFIATLLMIWGQAKFFGYHYLLIIPPFAVLTGYGLKRFLKTEPSWTRSFIAAKQSMLQIILWTILFGNLFVFAVSHYQYSRWHLLYLTNKITKKQYYDVFNEYPLHIYSFRADYDVVKYLKSNAKPGATIRTVYGGGDTIIHYLSGLRSPTRFTSTWYLFNKYLYYRSPTVELRQEFIEGIKIEKPDYILLIYHTLGEFVAEYDANKYPDLHEFMNFIRQNYVLEKSFRDRRTLYRRI